MNKLIKNPYREFKAGLYSCYPLCCTLFYTFCLNRLVDKLRYVKWTDKFNFDFEQKLYKYSAPYIKCPICARLYKYKVCRVDDNRGDCLNVSLKEAIKVRYKWSKLDASEKFKHNINVKR